MTFNESLFACQQVLRILVKKGILTEDEYDKIMAADITEMDRIVDEEVEWKEDEDGDN